MKPIFNKVFLRHNIDHKENPGRLKYLTALPEMPVENGERYLRYVHTTRYIDRVKFCCDNSLKFGGTPTVPDTFETACYGVGAAILAAESGGFALVRPGDHHTTPDLPDKKGSGYCFFNDMAIAVKHLLYQGKKIFVFDFDLHHGNGIEDCLIGLEGVIYFSTHQEFIWPWTGKKDDRNCFNLLYPFATDDNQYLEKLEKKLLLLLWDFRPDVLALYAGFDGYVKELGYLFPNQGFELTGRTYKRIKEIASDYFHFAIFGGGYNPESLKDCVPLFID